MESIKEYVPTSRCCIIRSNGYGNSLQEILDFFEEAKKDFPNLTPNQVNVVYYGGQWFTRFYGIEFQVPFGVQVPCSYKEISRVLLSY